MASPHEEREKASSVLSEAAETNAVDAATLFTLLDELKQLGVPVWVHGGWAVDAYTGTTRPHKDIDLLAEEINRPRLREHFRSHIKEETIHKLEFAYKGATVEVTFFQRAARGTAVTVTPRILVRWGRDSFADATAPLMGRPIPVVSLRALFVEVANQVKKNADMLAKNAQDLARLRPLLDESTIQAAQKLFPVPNTRWNRIRLRLGLL